MNPFSYFDIMYLVNCTNDKLGTDGATESDEFSEKIQTAFDPSPSFSENQIAVFHTALFTLLSLAALLTLGIL